MAESAKATLSSAETATVVVRDEATREALLCGLWQASLSPVEEAGSACQGLFPDDLLHAPAERLAARAELGEYIGRVSAIWDAIGRVERATLGECLDIPTGPVVAGLKYAREFVGSDTATTDVLESDHPEEIVSTYSALVRLLSELEPEAAEVSR